MQSFADKPNPPPPILFNSLDGPARALRVLVACEFSGVVRDAFLEKGHDAWSCDLPPAEHNSNRHIQCLHQCQETCAFQIKVIDGRRVDQAESILPVTQISEVCRSIERCHHCLRMTRYPCAVSLL